MDFGAGDLGFTWEHDPTKRKAVGRKILPALSTKSAKSMAPVLHQYIDLFVKRMKELGGEPNGVPMNDVSRRDLMDLRYVKLTEINAVGLYWLGTDMSADLAYNREMHHLRDGKTCFHFVGISTH